MKKILVALAVVVLISGLTAIAFGPKTAGYWIYTGYNYNKARDYANADKAFDWALKLKPGSIVAWNCKGSNYQSQHRHAEALTAFDRALAIEARNQSDDVERQRTLVFKSESLNKLERYEEAISTCDEYLNQYHDKGRYQDRDDIMLNKAFACGRLGHYSQALAVYRMSGSSLGCRGSYERACICSLMRDKSQALADLGASVKSRDYLYYYSNYRYDYEHGYGYKDMARSDKDFEWLWDDPVFINITEKTSDEWVMQGRDLAREGRYEEAIDKYDEAIELGNINAHTDRGYACLRLGRYDEAIEEFSSCPRNGHYYHDSKSALHGLACAYSLKKDKTRALDYLRQAIVVEHWQWKKAEIRKDADFKWLWDDADFKRITR